MPAPSTIDELLDLIRKSGVIDDKRLQQHLDRARATGQLPPDPLGLATQLVGDGVITHFQAEQFLQGKWRRFTIGKYKVLERLGAGGMGSVYLCEHTLMRRRVALKVLPAAKAKDSSSLDRFYREARAVAALDHPNIVRAYDIDHEEALHFLVMEHVDGASLQEMIKRVGQGMEAVRAAHYIRQAALGLQHAHETAGLVHRDIKPGNILVDRNGIVKVLDMGLARFFHDDEDVLTKKYDENVLGTADYLAPEQALDSHGVDIRADIYSLGGTFYYCLTGKTPFAEGSVAQKLIWHQTRQPKSIRSFRPDVPDGIIAVVEKMMAKDPAQRFQTPQEVADALAEWTQTPIPPPPEREMPHLSLAATRSLNAIGEGSMAGPRTPDRGKWNVSGTSSSHSTLVGETVVPNVPATPRPAPSRPATPAPPTPARPLSAAPVVPQMSIDPPSPPRAAPAVAVQATPPPAQAVPAPAPTPELQPIEEESDFPVMSSPLAGRETRRRKQEQGEGKPSPPWMMIGLGAGGGLVLLALAVVVYLVAFAPPEKPKGPPPREPLRVTKATRGGLTQVLRRVQNNDRVILETDLTETDVFVESKDRVKFLTIEAAEGKTITWRAPDGTDPQSKMLTIDGVGVTLKNIHLDGGGKPLALIQVFSKCDGLRLENLELKGMAKYGILFVNAEGSNEKPMSVAGVKIETAQPDQAGVRFFITPQHKTIRKNANLTLRDVTITGPGRKATQNVAGDTDAGSIDLPSGLTIELVPGQP